MWHYQSRRVEHGEEVWYELVEVYPELDSHTEKGVIITSDSREGLAKWLRVAADDVEKYSAIGETLNG